MTTAAKTDLVKTSISVGVLEKIIQSLGVEVSNEITDKSTLCPPTFQWPKRPLKAGTSRSINSPKAPELWP